MDKKGYSMVDLSAGLLLITLQIEPCIDHVIQSLRERAQSVQVQPSNLVYPDKAQKSGHHHRYNVRLVS